MVIALVWRWSVRGVDDAIRVAVIASLATVSTVINVIIPVPGIEVTSLVVVCCALRLDARLAMATGIMCTLAMGATAGLGPWTVWQVAGIGGMVLSTRLLCTMLRVRSSDHRPVKLQAVVMVIMGALVYDIITTIGGVFSLTGSTSLSGALLLGAPFAVVHLVAVGVIASLGASTLLSALDRVSAHQAIVTKRGVGITER